MNQAIDRECKRRQFLEIERSLPDFVLGAKYFLTFGLSTYLTSNQSLVAPISALSHYLTLSVSNSQSLLSANNSHC